MNYDELISGYFDGELTPEEDEALRQEIASNPELKADFDDAVFMHYALRNDAESLDVPEDLKRNTHDLVMMRMLADKSNSLPKNDIILSRGATNTTSQEPKITIVRRWHSASHFVASVAAMLILGFVNISEYSIFRHLNELYTYQNDHFDLTKINQNNTTTTTNTKIVYRNIIIRESASDGEISEIKQKVETAGDIIESNVEINAINETSQPSENNSTNIEVISMLAQDARIDEPADDNAIISNNTINPDNIIISENDINSEKESVQRNFASNANLSPNALTPKAMVSMPDADGNASAFSKNFEVPNSWINTNNIGRFTDNGNVQLELKSYYAGSSVFNSYMNSEHMINIGFSQSIGYSLDSKNKFGVEIGSINQRYKKVEMMEVPYQRFSNGDELLGPSPKVFLPYQRDDNVNYLWGTLFYEYNIIKEGGFNLDGRVNIGANGKGAMNIIRLTASYKVLGAINLSVGLDNRSFFVNNLSNKRGKSQFINSLSFIYGIEFTF